jgi:hypothetical protein
VHCREMAKSERVALAAKNAGAPIALAFERPAAHVLIQFMCAIELCIELSLHVVHCFHHICFVFECMQFYWTVSCRGDKL